MKYSVANADMQLFLCYLAYYSYAECSFAGYNTCHMLDAILGCHLAWFNCSFCCNGLRRVDMMTLYL